MRVARVDYPHDADMKVLVVGSSVEADMTVTMLDPAYRATADLKVYEVYSSIEADRKIYIDPHTSGIWASVYGGGSYTRVPRYQSIWSAPLFWIMIFCGFFGGMIAIGLVPSTITSIYALFHGDADPAAAIVLPVYALIAFGLLWGARKSYRTLKSWGCID